MEARRGREPTLLAIEDYIQPSERIVASCADVYATNQRLIHYTPRSKSLTFREFAYPRISEVKLVPKARFSTMLLGFIVTVLSLLAGPGSPFQMGVAVLGVAAMSMGLLLGDRYLHVAGEAKEYTVEWRSRDASRKNSREFIAAVQHAMLPPVERSTAAPTPEPQAAHSGAVPRTVLLAPADHPSLVRDAAGSSVDVVCLDMTSTVHHTNRDAARLMAWGEVAGVAGSDKSVWARIGMDSFREDLNACVWPGLSAVVAAGDSAEDVQEIESALASLEEERKITQQVGIVVALETATAVWAVRETLAASPRVVAASVSSHDLLQTPDSNGLVHSFPDMQYMQGRIIAGATEAGVPILGMLGTDIAPGHLSEVLGRDVEKRLSQSTQTAREDGFVGAMTTHPEVVLCCNSVFPGFKPPLQVLQPLPLIGAMFHPVIPSHFERKSAGETATALSTPAMQSVSPQKLEAAPQSLETWRPLSMRRQPQIPSPSAKWCPVVPADFTQALNLPRPQ